MKRIFRNAMALCCMTMMVIPAAMAQNKEASGWEKVWAAMPKFSGYAQVGYTYQTNVNGADGVNSSSFNVKRMRLIMTGDISKTFEYKMQLEGFSSSKGADNKALLSIQDMFLKAKISPALNIWAGQFPIPLTMENYDISPLTLEVPNFSSLVNKMVCRNAVTGFSSYGRDCGIQAEGGFWQRDGFSILNYNLVVYNGSQMNQSDDNGSKDIVGRITVRPIKDLRISGSVNWGQYTNSQFGKYIPMTRYAVGAWYSCPNGLMVRGEYGHAGADKTFGEGADARTAKVDEQMYYVIAGYNIKGKYMPLVRYDVFDAKENTCIGGAGKQQNVLVGFLWQPLSKLKVQADWTIQMYDSNKNSAADFGTKTGHMFELMVIGSF